MEAAKALTCGLCSREVLTPSGKDGDGKDLCGECAEARKAVVQRTCPHKMKRGITCVDCGKRCMDVRLLYVAPWTGLKWAGSWVGRLFFMYTIPAIASSAITAFVLWLLARKFGLV